jgi:hypothetical protein
MKLNLDKNSNFALNLAPSSPSKSQRRNGNNSDSEDLDMKLEIDRLNDIKNIMYLKGKIITDTKKIISNRNDFKVLMKEKKETEMLHEKQRLVMEKMADDFEKKFNNKMSPKHKDNVNYNNKNRQFSNMNFSINKRNKSSMKDFFLPNLEDNDNHRSILIRNSKLLNNFKTTCITDYDTRPRINPIVVKSKPRLSKMNSIEAVTPNNSSYLIKKGFALSGSISSNPFHKRVKSNVPLIFRGIGNHIIDDKKPLLPKVDKHKLSAFSPKPKHIKHNSVPESTFLEDVERAKENFINT